jgi:hypothetical protein
VRLFLRFYPPRTHEIRADKRPECEKNIHELAFNGVRISATFRCIGTFLTPDTQPPCIYGTGATVKAAPGRRLLSVDLDGAQVVQEQQRQLLHAFSAENREHAFDWDSHYGSGFDVLSIGLVA